MSDWIKVSDAKPPQDTEVETKIDDAKGARNHMSLKLHHNLWFLPDMSIYVYYTPTHWRLKP